MSLDDRAIYSERCTRCSQCKFVPMAQSDEFANICPSIDYGQFHSYSGGGKVITSYGYNQGAIEPNERMVESVYACTMCGACDTSCKTHMADQVEPFETLLELRARLAADGHVPAQMAELVAHLEAHGSPQGTQKDRANWAAGLDIPDAREQSVDVLLHVGSENAFDEEQWDQLRLLVKLLRDAGISFGIAYDGEVDSGGLAYEIGYQNVAEQLADVCIATLAQSKATILLAASAQDYSAFKNIYPRMGRALDPVRVLHTTEFVEELLKSGKLNLSLKSSGTVAYHDSCRLGRRSETYKPWEGEQIRVLNTLLVSDPPRDMNYGTDGNYDAPRAVLDRIAGMEVRDFERTREFSYCCGGGCGVKETYPDMADLAAVNCLDEAAAQGADTLVTASACCQRNMADAAKRHGRDVKVTTLFDLVSQSMVGEAG